MTATDYPNLLGLDEALAASSVASWMPKFYKNWRKQLAVLNSELKPMRIIAADLVTLYDAPDGSNGLGSTAVALVVPNGVACAVSKRKSFAFTRSEIGSVERGFNQYIGPAVQVTSPYGAPVVRLGFDERNPACEQHAERFLLAINSIVAAE
jgi:hypothetical protein